MSRSSFSKMYKSICKQLEVAIDRAEAEYKSIQKAPLLFEEPEYKKAEEQKAIEVKNDYRRLHSFLRYIRIYGKLSEIAQLKEVEKVNAESDGVNPF